MQCCPGPEAIHCIVKGQTCVCVCVRLSLCLFLHFGKDVLIAIIRVI